MIEIINAVISAVGGSLHWAISLLPPSPFQFISIDSQHMRFLNSIFPFMEAVAIMQIWVSAILVYYASRVLLRWLKVAAA